VEIELFSGQTEGAFITINEGGSGEVKRRWVSSSIKSIDGHG